MIDTSKIITAEMKAEQQKMDAFASAQAARQAAYTAEADPIAMQMLRDEATKEEWLAKIDEIKARFPYPEA